MTDKKSEVSLTEANAVEEVVTAEEVNTEADEFAEFKKFKEAKAAAAKAAEEEAKRQVAVRAAEEAKMKQNAGTLIAQMVDELEADRRGGDHKLAKQAERMLLILYWVKNLASTAGLIDVPQETIEHKAA